MFQELQESLVAESLGRAAALWLSARACDAGTAGLAGEPEEAEAALSRGETSGAEAWRPEASPRDKKADAGAGAAQRALEPGFRI